jgi:hypothetical protein
MTLDPLQLVTPEKRDKKPRGAGGKLVQPEVCFAMDPDQVYPVMFEQLRDEMPALPEGFRLDVDDPALLPPADRAVRALILERLRLAFTALLHARINQRPMVLHILKRPRWKL